MRNAPCAFVTAPTVALVPANDTCTPISGRLLPDAVIVPQPGQVMIGAEQVRAALQGFLDVNVRFSADTAEVIQTGDLALVAAQWSATIDGPDGERVVLGGVSSDVMRRQADGGWRYLIDQPWADQIVKAG